MSQIVREYLRPRDVMWSETQTPKWLGILNW